jgi:uncharacterized protein (TIGR02996 family)
MTPEEEGMLLEIAADPADDTPRLIYADWLEDDGRPGRAELIRVQLALADARKGCMCGRCVGARGGGQHTNGGCAADKLRIECGGRFMQARMREAQLLTDHAFWAVCTPPIGVTSMIMREKMTITRGFVSRWGMTLAQWLGWGPQVVKWHPLEEVNISDKGPRGPIHNPPSEYEGRWFLCCPRKGGDFTDVDHAWWLAEGMWPHLEATEGFLEWRYTDTWHTATYPTEAAARKAMNSACLAWAREKAKLLAKEENPGSRACAARG